MTFQQQYRQVTVTSCPCKSLSCVLNLVPTHTPIIPYTTHLCIQMHAHMHTLVFQPMCIVILPLQYVNICSTGLGANLPPWTAADDFVLLYLSYRHIQRSIWQPLCVHCCWSNALCLGSQFPEQIVWVALIKMHWQPWLHRLRIKLHWMACRCSAGF